jgi:hypothetical protein
LADSTPTDERLRTSRLQLHGGTFLVDTLNFAFVAVISAHAQYGLEASVVQLGIVAVAARIFYPLSSWFAGRQSDRRGSMILITASLLGMAFVVSGTLLAGSWLALIVASAAMRTCMGLFWAPLERQLALASPGATLWESLGIFNLVWAAGATLGNYGGPRAYVEWGFQGALFGCLLVTVAAILVLLLRRPQARPSGHDIPHENVDRATALRFLRMGWCANFCATAAASALPFFFLHAARRRGLPLESIGLILAAHQAGQCLSFAWLWKSPRWHYSLRWLLVPQLIAALGFLGCGYLSSVPILVTLMAAAGGFAGISYYSSLYYGLNLRTEEGKLSSLHEVFLGVGGCIGPLGCAVVAWAFPSDSSAAMVFLAALLGCGAAVETCLARKVSS